MRESTEPMAQLAQALILMAGLLYGRAEFHPFGLVLALDGTLGAVAEEGGYTAQDLMDCFTEMKHEAMAFAIVAMKPRKDGDCELVAVMEHRNGDCVLGTARLFRRENGQIDMADEQFVPSIPELFVVRH